MTKYSIIKIATFLEGVRRLNLDYTSSSLKTLKIITAAEQVRLMTLIVNIEKMCVSVCYYVCEVACEDRVSESERESVCTCVLVCVCLPEVK